MSWCPRRFLFFLSLRLLVVVKSVVSGGLCCKRNMPNIKSAGSMNKKTLTFKPFMRNSFYIYLDTNMYIRRKRVKCNQTWIMKPSNFYAIFVLSSLPAQLMTHKGQIVSCQVICVGPARVGALSLNLTLCQKYMAFPLKPSKTFVTVSSKNSFSIL